jgi:hypothetical protein
VPRNAVRAWLRGAGPETSLRLATLRRDARRRLQTQVATAVSALGAGLRAEGLGARLSREALPTRAEARETLAETLRLLGECLQRPRRIDVRGSVLLELSSRLEARATGGSFLLPATPAPLLLRLAADRVHLPHDRPAEPDVVAAVLAAMARAPLYL